MQVYVAVPVPYSTGNVCYGGTTSTRVPSCLVALGISAVFLSSNQAGTSSQAAKFLRANGITLFKVREETVNLLGKSDMCFFSPEHPPLTEQAQRALDWAVGEKLKSGAGENGEITTTYLLLGIWSEKESAGHKILATLGFNDEKAKEVEKNLNEDIVLNYK